jgi:CHAT domain-containing protein
MRSVAMSLLLLVVRLLARRKKTVASYYRGSPDKSQNHDIESGLQCRVSFTNLWIACVVVIAFAILIISACYVRALLNRNAALVQPGLEDEPHKLESTNAMSLLAAADHFYWLFNGPAAAPLYRRAEELFSQRGDSRNELHAKIGRIKSEAETRSFLDVSRLLGEQLQNPLVKDDKNLRLWCLIAKGYTDTEINYRAAKRDWMAVQKLGDVLGEKRWAARASGELGLIAFLEGNPGRAARLIGGALLSTMASGDTAGQIRFLELIARGFEEVNRHAEAMRFFNRAIKLAGSDKDLPLPFMAYEGKAQVLVATGKANDARTVLQDAIAKARAQGKRGHESQLLILLGSVAEKTGDYVQAIDYLEKARQLATKLNFYRMDADATFELAKLYRNNRDLATAEARANEGLAASQQVGDRYYVPRNLTVLADLKALRGNLHEANQLYEQAEDVVEGMLVSVDEPYWNSSVAASMSQTYLRNFELAVEEDDVPGAFRVLERVRGRTLAWALADKKAFAAESEKTASFETEIANLQLRLMQSNDRNQRELLLDQLTEDERRLGFAWTNGDATTELLPIQPAALRTVEGDLKPEEVLLEYVLDDPNSFCLSITRHNARLEQLPAGRKKIETLIKAYIAETREKRNGTAISKQLYNSLVKPISDVANAYRLTIVPDGILNLLPFEALQNSAGEFLIRSREITYVPSGTILETLHRLDTRPAPKSLLAIGDVAYQDQGNAGKELAALGSWSTRFGRGVTDLSGIALHDLPQTRDEVEKIGRLVGHNSVILVGREATETTFKKEPLDQFRIIHLAVHGFADIEYPERSALILGRDPNSTDDGLLQVREIIRLKLNAELATLSACDTGVGKLQGEEGVSNLVEAFLVAGARSVVASLWSADDTSSSALMEDFYQRLSHGETVSSGLRNAKLDMLSKFGNDLNPYYWAAFVSVGQTAAPITIRK